jgi:hypothetical protein
MEKQEIEQIMEMLKTMQEMAEANRKTVKEEMNANNKRMLEETLEKWTPIVKPGEKR